MRTNLSVSEAQDAILELISELPQETCPVADAQDRVLVEEVVSTRLLPPAACSAMDGYALAQEASRGASAASPARLPVAFEVAAGGQADCPLPAGQAARIFTGAPVPPGADCVVMQEHVSVEGDAILVSQPVAAGDHIREAGEDLQIGDRVIARGSVLRPSQIGVLASLGRAVVAVHRRPRVSILSSGDELVEPDGDIAGGRIVSSNSYTLSAQCREIGAEPTYLGIARDRPEDLEAHLRAGMLADCIVTSAGVSVGDHDHVKDVLDKLGCELIFWGIQMKPGHPVAFGRFPDDPISGRRGAFVFGLPGNPVSAAVTFEQFVRPALRKMLGHRSLFRPTLSARLATPLKKRPGRLNFVRVILERRGDEIWASSTGNQSSGAFSSMSAADALLIFPADASEMREGETATVQILDEGFFAQTTRGFEA
jgi:molybdopterin molybdotransferase